MNEELKNIKILKNKLKSLIENDDRKNNWLVEVIANRKMVNIFQCRTKESAIEAAHLIKEIRSIEKLTTRYARMEKIISSDGGRKLANLTLIDLD